MRVVGADTAQTWYERTARISFRAPLSGIFQVFDNVSFFEGYCRDSGGGLLSVQQAELVLFCSKLYIG